MILSTKALGAIDSESLLSSPHRGWKRRLVASLLAPAVLLPALHSSALGRDQFGQAQTLGGSVEDPQDLLAVDLDGDGDLDVVTASEDDNKVAWYENLDGLATFGPQRVITDDAVWVRSVDAADLDGDGDLDVLSASYLDEKLAWYENLDGLGNFGPEIILDPATPRVDFVAAADIDGDGDADIVAGARVGQWVSWYENVDGAGTFGPETEIDPALATPDSFAVADLDGDGDLDVVCSSNPSTSSIHRILWYENTDGAGQFSGPLVVADVTCRELETEDVDGDGDLDILARVGSSSTVLQWYENLDGSAGTWSVHALASYCAYAFNASDLDGDGDPDLLLGLGCSGGTSGWAENDGSGVFGPVEVFSTLASTFLNAVTAADLDGDGDADVLAGEHKTYTDGWYDTHSRSDVVWHENTDGVGSFSPRRPVSFDVKYVSSVVAADLDGDQKPDLLSASPGDDEVSWYKSQGGASLDFGMQQKIGDSTALEGVFAVEAVDIDGDSDLDVVWAAAGVWWQANDGAGSFSEKILIGAGPFLSGFKTADADGDGDPDVFFWFNGDFSWVRNLDGLGTFGADIEIDEDQFITEMTPADVDGDGDLDAVTGHGQSGGVSWYENRDGLGNFGPRVVASNQVGSVYSLVAVDMESDGDQDVLLASGGTIMWLENLNGLGSFSAPQVISSSIAGLNAVGAADIDQDGDLDVLYTSAGGSFTAEGAEIAFLEHLDGQGTFGAKQVLLTDLAAKSIEAVDLDSDGDLDLVTGLHTSAQLAVFENQLCAATPSAEVVRAGSPPNPIAFLPGATSGPVICSTWDPSIDHTSFGPPNATLDFALVAISPANLPTASGTFLCDLSTLLAVVGALPGAAFQIPVPANCALVGVSLCVQGGTANPSNVFALANALDITIGTWTLQ